MNTRLALGLALLLSTAAARAQVEVSICTAPDANLYSFEGVVTEVVDGDTVLVDLLVFPENDIRPRPTGLFRIGDGTTRKNLPVRLRDAFAPKFATSPKKAKAARDFLASVVRNKRVIVKVGRGVRDPSGAVLVWLHFHDGKIWHNASEMMVALGYAELREF